MKWGRGGCGRKARRGMTLKVVCEQCGKVSQYSASDAGMTALCVACGSRFTIPAGDANLVPQEALKEPAPWEPLTGFVPAETIAVPTTPAEAAAANLRAAVGATANVGGGTEAIPTAPPLDVAPVRARGVNYAVLYTLLGSAVTVAIVFAAVVVLSAKPTWEDRHRTALRDLKARAEGFVVEQKLRQAYDTYRQMDEMVAGHEVEDPKLRTELERARADRDEL